VIVAPEFQDKGVGKDSVNRLKQKYNHTPIFINIFNESKEFFQKCGLKKKSGNLIWYEKSK
jgi:N-acetylglutamate synthase-like GNAT family acetyltransferase